MRKLTGLLGLLAVLCAPVASAATQEIRALFQPDSSQPNKNTFVNKTPNSGYCASYPVQCADRNTFSIQLPVRFNGTRAIARGEQVGIKAPAGWRQLTVTNQLTQETETVEVRISGMGTEYVLSQPAADLVGLPGQVLEGHRRLWIGDSWVYPGLPCTNTNLGAYSPTNFRFFWRTPQEAWCRKTAEYRIPSMYFNTLDFEYELRTPDPMGMSSGQYSGSLTYTLGPGGDFEMGPAMVPDDQTLTLDFVLDVQHTLKVDLPPGGNRITLEPEGGWQRWLDGGQKPTQIYRDQPFYISSSSRFRVWMECAESAGAALNDGCNMKSPVTSRRLKFYPKLTLPVGIKDNIGRDVTLQMIQHKQPSGIYSPQHYVDRKQGSLRFKMDIADVNYILKPGMSDDFNGFVTIIWDSDV
ncbi:hypothetical protein ACREYJ_22700 [Pseudomonas kribbensis]|uniref:hypothetical protein n=1 Tax=Pseudomonas kribbensis TaxID=1628086 RepID=UPI003D76D81C